MPPLGMGQAGASQRAAIQNRAAELLQQQGLKADGLRESQLGFKGDVQAQTRAKSNFGSGVEGRTARSLNVATQHLNTKMDFRNIHCHFQFRPSIKSRLCLEQANDNQHISLAP